MQTSGMGDPFVIVYVESCICSVLHLGCLHWFCMRFWLFCFKRDNRFVNAAVEGLMHQWKTVTVWFFVLWFYWYTNGSNWFLSEFNISSGGTLIKNSYCKLLGFSRTSYCKSCNWKRHTWKYFTENLMFLHWTPGIMCKKQE